MIHLYYGDGKGKTTAAFGLALRNIGYGLPVVAVQFLKGRPSGEVEALKALEGVSVFSGMETKKFYKDMTEAERQAARMIHDRHLFQGIQKARENAAGILLLDEVIDAYELNLLDKDALVSLLKDPVLKVEIVMTGHSCPAEIAPFCDYITCMEKKKHPYDRGVKARKGIEY